MREPFAVVTGYRLLIAVFVCALIVFCGTLYLSGITRGYFLDVVTNQKVIILKEDLMLHDDLEQKQRDAQKMQRLESLESAFEKYASQQQENIKRLDKIEKLVKSWHPRRRVEVDDSK